MQTNDIKKGTRIKLHNGWFGTMMDNKKGNARLAEIQGIYTETGSVYAWDISHAHDSDNDQWLEIELTDKQKEAQAMVGRVFL